MALPRRLEPGDIVEVTIEGLLYQAGHSLFGQLMTKIVMECADTFQFLGPAITAFDGLTVNVPKVTLELKTPYPIIPHWCTY
jgi:hypothetical protein